MPADAQARDATERAANPLLACGLVAGPLFITVVLAQAIVRPGFSLMRVPLSLLALGHWGWVQTANFLLTGILIVAFAVGVRRAMVGKRMGVIAPTLLGLHGFGLLIAGTFPAQAIENFPLGAHQDPVMTFSSKMHGLGFGVAQTAVLAGMLLLATVAVRNGKRGWATYCIVSAVAAAVMVATGFTHQSLIGSAFFSCGVVTMAWLFALASRLRAGQ